MIVDYVADYVARLSLDITNPSLQGVGTSCPLGGNRTSRSDSASFSTRRFVVSRGITSCSRSRLQILFRRTLGSGVGGGKPEACQRMNQVRVLLAGLITVVRLFWQVFRSARIASEPQGVTEERLPPAGLAHNAISAVHVVVLQRCSGQVSLSQQNRVAAQTLHHCRQGTDLHSTRWRRARTNPLSAWPRLGANGAAVHWMQAESQRSGQ